MSIVLRQKGEALHSRARTWWAVAHNAPLDAASSILQTLEGRPSTFDADDEGWLPPLSFYARVHADSRCMSEPRSTDTSVLLKLAQSLQVAAKFGGGASTRPLCVHGWAAVRQTAHKVVKNGGVHADIVTGYYHDLVRGADRRWAVRSSQFAVWGVAAFWNS